MDGSRVNIHQTTDRTTRRAGVAMSALALLAMGLFAWRCWYHLPAEVITQHATARRGETRVSRLVLVTQFPLAEVLVSVLFLAIANTEYGARRYARTSGHAFLAVWTALSALLVVADAVLVSVFSGRRLPALSIMAFAVGVFLILLGNYLPKLMSRWPSVDGPGTSPGHTAWRAAQPLLGALLAVLGALLLIIGVFMPRTVALTLELGVLLLFTATAATAWRRARRR